MSVFDELVEESQPTLTSMPERKRLDEPWHWEIRLNFPDSKGEPLDLSKAQAHCEVRTADGDTKVCDFTTACGQGLVTIDAGRGQIAAVTEALDKGECVWSLDLTLPEPDGRTVRVFGPDSLGLVPELMTYH